MAKREVTTTLQGFLAASVKTRLRGYDACSWHGQKFSTPPCRTRLRLAFLGAHCYSWTEKTRPQVPCLRPGYDFNPRRATAGQCTGYTLQYCDSALSPFLNRPTVRMVIIRPSRSRSGQIALGSRRVCRTTVACSVWCLTGTTRITRRLGNIPSTSPCSLRPTPICQSALDLYSFINMLWRGISHGYSWSERRLALVYPSCTPYYDNYVVQNLQSIVPFRCLVGQLHVYRSTWAPLEQYEGCPSPCRAM